MRCEKCGFQNEDNLNSCGNCGNQIVTPEQPVIPGTEQIQKNKLTPKRDPFAQNYNKIFNICLFTVIWLVIIFIFISLFRDSAFIYSNLIDMFVWLVPFFIFIFIFKKNHRVWALVLSIAFGCMTILTPISSYILSWLQQ